MFCHYRRRSGRSRNFRRDGRRNRCRNPRHRRSPTSLPLRTTSSESEQDRQSGFTNQSFMPNVPKSYNVSQLETFVSFYLMMSNFLIQLTYTTVEIKFSILSERKWRKKRKSLRHETVDGHLRNLQHYLQILKSTVVSTSRSEAPGTKPTIRNTRNLRLRFGWKKFRKTRFLIDKNDSCRRINSETCRMKRCQFHHHFTSSYFLSESFKRSFSVWLCNFLAKYYWGKSNS